MHFDQSYLPLTLQQFLIYSLPPPSLLLPCALLKTPQNPFSATCMCTGVEPPAGALTVSPSLCP